MALLHVRNYFGSENFLILVANKHIHNVKVNVTAKFSPFYIIIACTYVMHLQ